VSSSASQPSGPTLHDSIAVLQGSVHLGVVTANLDRIIDANDCFLRMIRYSREEMEAGLIDWRAMTPPDSLARDEVALQQLREYGASVPFEKEYILRDGTHLPMLMGGIRLRKQPLEWVCYVFDLTDQKRAEAAERQTRDLQALSTVVNDIAHALNNPLAALTLLVNALQLRPSVQADAEASMLLAQAEEMLQRVTALTRAVLLAGRSSG
jgi:PAS domain S-box-containing protein